MYRRRLHGRSRHRQLRLEPLERRQLLANTLTSILSSAAIGSPANAGEASANVRQAITLQGTGFLANDQITFPTLRSDGVAGTRNVAPSQVAADGLSMMVVVPDDATTGNVTIVGAAGSDLLQIVPTITGTLLPDGGFNGGQRLQLVGSGLIEGGLTVRWGTGGGQIEVQDFSPTLGPEITNGSFHASVDRADNDLVTLTLPPNAPPGPITVLTAGGTAASPNVSFTQIVSVAGSGEPAVVATPSANAGQTIQVNGSGFSPLSRVSFPTISIDGTIASRTVQPDFVRADGTLLEVRVPDDALTGNVSVIGASNTLPLQIVPTIQLVEQTGATTVRILGSGFTDNSNLTVEFNNEQVQDLGAQVEVATAFLPNDTISVSIPSGGVNPVRVITAGGRSNPVSFQLSTSGGGNRDVAVFPASAGADAGRFATANQNGDILVIDPLTRAVLRTITRPGVHPDTGCSCPFNDQMGLEFLPEALAVQDPVRGLVNVPAGSLIVSNGGDAPDMVYYLNPTGSGTILASLPLGGATPVDEAGGVGITYHPVRHTLFAQRSGDLISEFSPTTGAHIRSFHTGHNDSFADLTVDPTTRNLWVAVGSRLLGIDVNTGRALGEFDAVTNAELGTIDTRQNGPHFPPQPGVFPDIVGLGFDSSGVLQALTREGRIFPLQIPAAAAEIRVDGAMAVARDGIPDNALVPSANPGQRITLVGAGYHRFTEIEFPRVTSAGDPLRQTNGDPGAIRVPVDAIRRDPITSAVIGVDVVVPSNAVSGLVRVAGVPGEGLPLQIVPTLRLPLPTDPNDSTASFNAPLENGRVLLFGTGFVEGDTSLRLGGETLVDRSTNTTVDVRDSGPANSRLDFRIPEGGLSGPVTVRTDGGSFTLDSFPIGAAPIAGVTGITAAANRGTPANGGAPSANAGQSITLTGFGFSTSSHVVFPGVAADGTRASIVVRPTTVPNSTTLTVVVPALAVTGPVTVAGSATSVDLQIVPTLDAVSTSNLVAGAAARLIGTGIPEGANGAGQTVTYTVGGGSTNDNDPSAGPDVLAGVDQFRAVDLTIPVGASGQSVTVTTAGGSDTIDFSAQNLRGITSAATAGTPANTAAPSANSGQTITLTGQGFSAATRVRFQRHNSDRPQDGVTEIEVAPSSVAGDGSSLTVAVPFDAITGSVRLSSEATGITLQIVPTVSVVDVRATSFTDDSVLRISGSGFVEGAHVVHFGGVEARDVWSTEGADVFNQVCTPAACSGRPNSSIDVRIPLNVPAGPIQVRTLGGSSAPLGTLTGFGAGTVAVQGTPANNLAASANVRQTITLVGTGFNATTEVVFPTRPQAVAAGSEDAISARVVAPTFVAPDGATLTVVVPDDAMTGNISVVGRDGSLFLQIVPTLVKAITPAVLSTGVAITLQGSGLIEDDIRIELGDTLLLDTGSFQGPNVVNTTVGGGLDRADNDGVTFALPPGSPAGPFKVTTRGGSAELTFQLDAVLATATSGTPANPVLPSANARQAITILGEGFDLESQVVFRTVRSSDGFESTVNVSPTRVFSVPGTGSGQAIEVVVPDNALTGPVTVVGATGSVTLQIVPTISDVGMFDPAFATGTRVDIAGSGFTEGNTLSVRFGATTVNDTGANIDISNGSFHPLFDRADNDFFRVALPAGADTGLVTVTTAGGTSAPFPITMTAVEGLAVAGTPANPAQASANSGQMIRLRGTNFDLSTEVIFPTISDTGAVSSRFVRPAVASADGTLLEVLVPEDALTGNVRVFGATGSIPLQIVPTLEFIQSTGATTVRLLGSGFTDNSNLTVTFGGSAVVDSGANVDVLTQFLANDTIAVTVPGGAGTSVTVTTAGGTSAAVTNQVTDPPGAAEMRDIAVFPATAGGDANRLVVAETNGNFRVLDPVTLALVRTVNRPGAVSDQIGLDFLTAAVTVQDAVRGPVNVPAGSLIVANGDDTPDRLYYLDPAGTGTVLADVPLGGPSQIDVQGATAIVYHPARGTLFTMSGSGEFVSEIDPATGRAVRGYRRNAGGSVGALEVLANGNLILAGNATSGNLLEMDAETGRLIGSYDRVTNVDLAGADLRQFGALYGNAGAHPSGLAFDNSGNLLATTVADSRILRLEKPGEPTAIQTNGALAAPLDGTPANLAVAAANSSQTIRLLGSGFTKFTEVEFPRHDDVRGLGFIQQRASVVAADGSFIEVTVPLDAITGNIRIAGSSGPGLPLQVVPTLRRPIPADADELGDFDLPFAQAVRTLPGSGLAQGQIAVTYGAEADTSGPNLPTTGADVGRVNAGEYDRVNNSVTFDLPNRTLISPVTIATAGGSMTLADLPIRTQASVGVTSIIDRASQGVPADPLIASANVGQTITVNGFGFTATSNILFAAIADDGSIGQVLTRPATVASDGLSITVAVPPNAITGSVTAAGSATGATLQIVPTITASSTDIFAPGGSLRLFGTGIHEGATARTVTYTFGGGTVVDNSGAADPNVQSALDNGEVVDLVLPAGTSGDTIIVTTTGGSFTFRTADRTASLLVAEAQGAGADDGVGNSIGTATAIPLLPNDRATVTGRIDPAEDLDVYQLVGVEGGGELSVAATGAQGTNARFRVFDENGNPLTGSVASLTQFVMPPRANYFLAYSSRPNETFNVADGSDVVAGVSPGDYTLTVRYVAPGTTSLTGITAAATQGTAANPAAPSANSRQTITLTGTGFSAATRVRFTTFNADRPQDGLRQQEVVPASVAPDGLSLTVVVPDAAVTGPVRLSDETSGILLQIVPTIAFVNVLQPTMNGFETLRLAGSGLTEGSSSLTIDGITIRDLWNVAGPSIFNSFCTPGCATRTNAGGDWTLPRDVPAGPIQLTTVGGSSNIVQRTFTGITSSAQTGTPRNAGLASANVGQAITLNGTAFTLQTEVVFRTSPNQSTTENQDDESTRIVTPVAIFGGGTSMTVIVPDDARTGDVRIVGANGSQFLQIVPTLAQIITPTTFATGQTLIIEGSGLVENDLEIVLGNVIHLDTGPFLGPDSLNGSIGAGLDKSTNDQVNLNLPPGAATTPFIVRTSGGEATLVSVNAIVGVALSGTPANVALPSANAGQTIRVLGDGINLATQIIFPTIDANGTISNTAVRPDFASSDGTIGEVRVPLNAFTGDVQVVGAAGAFPLQVVPTLHRAQLQSGSSFRLLGSGFTENSNLSVQFGASNVVDAGANIAVANAVLANDDITVTRPGGGGDVVTVTTAGGTSQPSMVLVDNPASVADIRAFAVFPATAGADAGRYVVIGNGDGSIRILEAATLAQVRAFARPGGVLASTEQSDLDFITVAVTVQDAVRGAVNVPAGSLLFANGEDTPDRLYYLDPVTGTVLADVALGGPINLDMAGAIGIAFHPGRGSLFAMQNERISEIDPATGLASRTFHLGTNNGLGDLVVDAAGTLVVSLGGDTLVHIDPATGRQVHSDFDPLSNTQGSIDLSQQGINFAGANAVGGMAFDNTGRLLAATSGGRILPLTRPGDPAQIRVDAMLAVAIDGTPTNAAVASANPRQRIRLVGSGLTRSTQIQFPQLDDVGGAGFAVVRVDAVSADGTLAEVVVPDQAVTGNVRVVGAPGAGLPLQVTPYLRRVLPADPTNVNFDDPRASATFTLFGGGFVEGATRITFGARSTDDNTIDNGPDVLDLSTPQYNRANGRLDVTLPEFALAGPVTIETAGGRFTSNNVPIRPQEAVGIDDLTAMAASGTPANPALPSANIHQQILFTGFNLTTATRVVFSAVADDGTLGELVVLPTAVPDSTQMLVTVPLLAVTGPVRVAGAPNPFFLQIVPTLTGVSSSTITPGASLRLAGTGIPEGGPGVGQAVTYDLGAVIVDTIGNAGPDVFAAHEQEQEINLTVPAGASGSTITVTTAGGTATLRIADISSLNLAPEPQGNGAADGVGGTLATATDIALTAATRATVTGRLDPNTDVDLFRLVNAEPGGRLSVSATGLGTNARFRLFHENGTAIGGPSQSLDEFVLPVAGQYFLGFSARLNESYDVMDGSGTAAGATVSDYSLSLRYSAPGATVLNSTIGTATLGTPADAAIASANPGQTVTLNGEAFDASTRVVVPTVNADRPQDGVTFVDVVPSSVAPDGSNLTFVVPANAITGVVRVDEDGAGLILQIVPTITSVDATGNTLNSGSDLVIRGSGFVDGALRINFGATALDDPSSVDGPNVFNNPGQSANLSFDFPVNAPAGPITVSQLGGTSNSLVITFTGIAAGTVASLGIPANGAQASANVGQSITLTGSGFSFATEVVFPTRPQGSTFHVNLDIPSFRTVLPWRVSADGTTLSVVVPDDARTGDLRIVGAGGTSFLQVVPTLLLTELPSPFTSASGYSALGSGFTEDDVSIRFGDSTIVDTGSFFGLDPRDTGINVDNLVGRNASDNDLLGMTLPPNARVGPITVATSGGSFTTNVVITAIEAVAISGTPANAGAPSANPRQTIRITGQGLDLNTAVLFPINDDAGGTTNRLVAPEYAKSDGTLIEVVVPEDAFTGNLGFVGSAASLPLQIVPTLSFGQRLSNGTVQLLGSGFSENRNLSVLFGAVNVVDAGANVDVLDTFLPNDTLSLPFPGGGADPVTVTTAGGTSSPINLVVNDPPTVGDMRDLAVFPAGAGADAGRYVVAENNGQLQVLDPVTLVTARTITRPGAGAANTHIGLDFLPEAITVQDAVRGAVNVPAGSLIVTNGNDTPDRLYYLDPADAGSILADVVLGAAAPLDTVAATAVAYHPTRRTLFVIRGGSDVVTEINPLTGDAIKSFHVAFSGSAADLVVRPDTGTLLISSDATGSRLFEIEPETGKFIDRFDPLGNSVDAGIDLRRAGIDFRGNGEVSGLGLDAAGRLVMSTAAGRILSMVLATAPTAIQVGLVPASSHDGVAMNAAVPSANARQTVRIVGAGYDRFTRVEFPIVDDTGEPGFARVSGVAAADGSFIEVVVPDEAVTGAVRVKGTAGNGLTLQIVPMLRGVTTTDPDANFDSPTEGADYRLVGSGFVEGATRITYGGVLLDDNVPDANIDVNDQATSSFTRQNGALSLNVPERALTGPLRIETAGGSVEIPASRLRNQLVQFDSIDAFAPLGTPFNALAPSANTGQTITLRGFGFTTSTLVVFESVAENGVGGRVVATPAAIGANGTSAMVVVPALAVTGTVRVSDQAVGQFLQIVPTLTGISSSTITPGGRIRLAGTGIPEGGASAGQGVDYAFGAAVVTDTSGTTGPNVRSAVDTALQIDLDVPAAATGNIITVTTAGGSARLILADLIVSNVAAETPGAGQADGVTATLATALDLALTANAQVTVTGRLNAPDDVDLFRLDGAEPGGLLSLSATGQGNNARFRLFDENGNPLAGPAQSFNRIRLPRAGDFFVGYSSNGNTSYSVVDGSGVASGAASGDYSLVLRYATPGATSLDFVTTVAASGTPDDAAIGSANPGQSMMVTGEQFDANTRLRVNLFDNERPQDGLQETELTPTALAGDGTSVTITATDTMVTGVVRLPDEPAGLIYQIVPTLTDAEGLDNFYRLNSALRLFGRGLVDGATTLLLGAQEIQDVWEFSGPNPFNRLGNTTVFGADFEVPEAASGGVVRVRTLGGTSAVMPIEFSGFAPGTNASRGTPTTTALASANVAQTVRLLGTGFTATTQVEFVTRLSGNLPGVFNANNPDVTFRRLVVPVAVAGDGTSIDVVVPDDAETGEVRVVGAGPGRVLQVVPTIAQVVTPANFATGQTVTIQGSGFIEGDMLIGVGDQTVSDFESFFWGPDSLNANITLVGQNRSDNDGISLLIPPGGDDGPWFVRTAGGTARQGITLNLGTVIETSRTGRSVGNGEQEFFRATAAVIGWLDFDVRLLTGDATLTVLRSDGSTATILENERSGNDLHLRVATDAAQTFTLIVNGFGGPATFDVTVINHDRFDDPIGAENGQFNGSFGIDPDGRNDAPTSATFLDPASAVTEPGLDITVGDVDWFGITPQATGILNVAALFSAASGQLRLRVFDDANDSGVLDPAELATPLATGVAAADGARANDIPVVRGRRYFMEIIGLDGNGDQVVDINTYDLSLANVDRIDAGLLAGHAPGNDDSAANAVNLGTDVSWSSLELTDQLTLDAGNDSDFFLVTPVVDGAIQVIVSLPHRGLGTVAVVARDAGTNATISQTEFQDQGNRQRFVFGPVVAGQAVSLQFSGPPNDYAFAVANNDILEPNDAMGAATDLGSAVLRQFESLSLPGLPDTGPRDEDWFRVLFPVDGGRLDVLATPDVAPSPLAGSATLRIWQDLDSDLLPDAPVELLVESSGLANVLASAAANRNQAYFVQILDPTATAFTGVRYGSLFRSVDHFDAADVNGAANNTPATATDLGRVVQFQDANLTLTAGDEDWFQGVVTAANGDVDLTVEATGDPVVVNLLRDTNADMVPDTVVATGNGNSIQLLDIPATAGEMLWVQLALLDPGRVDPRGAVLGVTLTNDDRFDDALGDGVGGTVSQASGTDFDGRNDGPRTGGILSRGSLRLVQPNPAVRATLIGNVGLSTDALGTFTTGNLQAEVPAGSTVEHALLYVPTRSLDGPRYRPTNIRFEGSLLPIAYLPNVGDGGTVDAPVNFETGRVDVTSIVRQKIGAAGGTFDFAVDETVANAGLSLDGNDRDLARGVEGTALVVVFTNPALPVRTVMVFEGGVTGPTPETLRLAFQQPADPTAAGFVASLAMGAQFSFLADAQFSTIDINGQPLSHSIGNFDDGQDDNGALITVGGVGDTPANPAVPLSRTDFTDDELYTLVPFISLGDRLLTLQTSNPSNEDSVFLAALLISGQVNLAPQFTDLGTLAARITENDLTLSPGDEDWFFVEASSTGDIVTRLTFDPGGSGSAQFFLDADRDGVPDDLNDDGIADPVGTVTTIGNTVRVADIPNVSPGATFLLRVFDPMGQASFDLQMSVNQPPVANAGDDVTVAEGTPVTRAGTFTDADAGNTHAFLWEVRSATGTLLATSTTVQISFTPADDDGQPYQACFRVTDNEGSSNTDCFQINVTNVPPAMDPPSPQNSVEGSLFTLPTVSFSDPGFDESVNGTVESFTGTINWGDNTIDAANVASTSGGPGTPSVGTLSGSHVYADNGLYTVTICVSDDNLGETCRSFQLTVDNVSPTVTAGADATIDEGATFRLPPATFSDPGFDSVPAGTEENFTAAIDWGDTNSDPGNVVETPGSAGVLTTGTVSGSHLFAQDGMFTVEVCVTDDDLGRGCDSLIVTVRNVAPLVAAGPDATIDEGGTFTGTGSFTDPGADTWTATVDYGEGAGPEPLTLSANKTFNLSNLYQQDSSDQPGGVFTVRVCVSDDDATVCDDLSVTVRNLLSVDAGQDATITRGETFTGLGSFVDPGADSHSASVDFGEGAGPVPLVLDSNKTLDLSNVYENDGIFNVQVCVTDDDTTVCDALRVTVLARDSADLRLAKTVNKPTPLQNETVTFVVTVVNDGPSPATGVEVADPLPGGLAFVSAMPSQGEFDRNTGRWQVGTLTVNGSATLTLLFTASTVATITNTAQVSTSNQPDPDSTPNNNVPAEDDQASVDVAVVGAGLNSISGFVYVDTNDNGVREAHEQGLPQVPVTITGPVSMTVTTAADGSYAFLNLPSGTYAVAETQPRLFLDGRETQGSPPLGTVENDRFSGLTLIGDVHAVDYNFGERGIQLVSKTLLFASTPSTADMIRQVMAPPGGQVIAIRTPGAALLSASAESEASTIELYSDQFVPLFVGRGDALKLPINGQQTYLLYATTPDGSDPSPRISVEPRLTSSHHNEARPLDVNNDRSISPIDILLILNELNNRRLTDRDGRFWSEPTGNYLDTNHDRSLSPQDILLIINHLNSERAGEGESAADGIATWVLPTRGDDGMSTRDGINSGASAMESSECVGLGRFEFLGLAASERSASLLRERARSNNEDDHSAELDELFAEWGTW